jgi:hypothetical protein
LKKKTTKKKEKITKAEKIPKAVFHTARRLYDMYRNKILSNTVILYMKQFDLRIVRPDKSKDMQ